MVNNERGAAFDYERATEFNIIAHSSPPALLIKTIFWVLWTRNFRRHPVRPLCNIIGAATESVLMRRRKCNRRADDRTDFLRFDVFIRLPPSNLGGSF